MMRSATDFLPLSINTLMNFATSTFRCFGSGRISRFGTSLRLGIGTPYLDLSFVESSGSAGDSALAGPPKAGLYFRRFNSGFRFLCAVLRARLLAILDARGIERAAYHVIANAGQVLDATAANQHHRVFLQVVAFAADVADDFEAVREPHLGDLAQSGIRLLRRRRVHPRANPALLGTLLQRRDLAFRHGGLTALPHELIDGWHLVFRSGFPECAHPASSAWNAGLMSHKSKWPKHPASRETAKRRLRPPFAPRSATPPADRYAHPPPAECMACGKGERPRL